MARKLAGDEIHGDESVGDERPPHPSLAIYELAMAIESPLARVVGKLNLMNSQFD
jgi:hypothetical protein